MLMEHSKPRALGYKHYVRVASYDENPTKHSISNENHKENALFDDETDESDVTSDSFQTDFDSGDEEDYREIYDMLKTEVYEFDRYTFARTNDVE